MTQYNKFIEKENIQIGDLVYLQPGTDRVRLAFNTFKHKCNQIIRSVCKN